MDFKSFALSRINQFAHYTQKRTMSTKCNFLVLKFMIDSNGPWTTSSYRIYVEISFSFIRIQRVKNDFHNFIKFLI